MKNKEQISLIDKLKRIVCAILHPFYYFQSQRRIRLREEYNKKKLEGVPISYNLASGIDIKLNSSGQIAEMLYVDKFEDCVIERVTKFIKPGMNMIDAGANVGLYSILAGKIMKNDGRIWAFEPASDTVKTLKSNLKLNKINCVEVVHSALFSKDGQILNLVYNNECLDAERFLSIINTVENKNLSRVETIETITLDSFFKKKNNLKIDFIKIDIEGSEFDALNGAKDILKNNKNIVIMFENAPICLKKFGYDQNNLYNFLRNLGFSIFAWDDRCKKWLSDENTILKTGNLWACKDIKLLPV